MPTRPATAADIPAILALERAAPEAAHWSREQYESALSNATAHRVCWLSENDSQVDGFLIARRLDSEWEIENLAVSPSKRRQGIGAHLLAAFLVQARSQGADAIFLEVRRSNSAARALYEKCGFIHKGMRTGYYRNPHEDAAVYRLSFG